MLPGEPHDCIVRGFVVDTDSEGGQVLEKAGSISFRDPLPPFAHDEDVSDFEPKQTRNDGLLRPEASQNQASPRIPLIFEHPGCRD